MTSSAACSKSSRLAPLSRAGKVAVRWAEDPEPHLPEVSELRQTSAVLSSSPWPAASPPLGAPSISPSTAKRWSPSKARHWRSRCSPRTSSPYHAAPSSTGPVARHACEGRVTGAWLRVDGRPNVMTCMTPCRGGERLETQNVLGSRQVDLLQVTDWFFPRGIDHHHLLAGVPAASFVMQKVARHVAGLGRLPDEVAPTATARRRASTCW